MIVSSSIFREYDIRGIVGQTLFENNAYIIGKGFCSLNKKLKSIVVCRDGRLSSPLFSETIKECSKAVIASQGIKDAFSTGSQNHQPPQPNS